MKLPWILYEAPTVPINLPVAEMYDKYPKLGNTRTLGLMLQEAHKKVSVITKI